MEEEVNVGSHCKMKMAMIHDGSEGKSCGERDGDYDNVVAVGVAEP